MIDRKIYENSDTNKKVELLIENANKHFEFVQVFLDILRRVLASEDEEFKIFLNTLAEETHTDNEIFDSAKKISLYLCRLAFKPFIDEGFITEEKAEKFIEKDPWRLYTKTLHAVRSLKDGLITQEEYNYIIYDWPNPTNLERLYTLIELYGSNYLELTQAKKIKEDPDGDKTLMKLAVYEEEDSGNRFSLGFSVREGLITQDQLEKIMLINVRKKRNNIAELFSGGTKKTKLKQIMRYLEHKNINLSKVDLAAEEDKFKIAVDILFEYVDKVNSETNS